jgi:hypothetical protein
VCIDKSVEKLGSEEKQRNEMVVEEECWLKEGLLFD